MADNYTLGIVIPVYNHGSTLKGVVSKLSNFGVPVIVVDDGNDERNKAEICKVAAEFDFVIVVHRSKNGGKGKAMKAGLFKAQELNLTHILQIDSDGQHDAARVERFLELSKSNPNAVICGYPEYDETAPKKRVQGRKIANFFVNFVTLSKSIKDAMIGFRIYPVKACCDLFKSHCFLDSRMGYDIDVLVHLSWRGVPIISESVKVFYPSDGISNFRLFQDNLRISFMYARLCIGMFLRFPFLVGRNVRRFLNGK